MFLKGRTDLPLPVWMFAYGAGAALLISFAGLALFWRSTRLEGGGVGRVVLPNGRLRQALFVLGRVVGFGLFLLVVGAAAFGDRDTVQNIAPVFVYVVFWVGMTMICALVGDLWRVVNPFATLAALVEGVRRRKGTLEGYRWGRWPAVAALTGFVWLELVPSNRAEPRTLAVAIVGYTIMVTAGTLRWGRDWLNQGEASPSSSACWGTWPPSTWTTRGGYGCARRSRAASGSRPTPPPRRW